MADEVKIVFGADTSDLKDALDEVKTGLAASKSGFDATTISAKDFASALAATGNDIDKAVKLLDGQAVSAVKAAGALKGEAQALSAMPGAMSATAAGAEQAAKAHDHLSMSSVGAKRELVVLAHEMVQGNYSRLGGSLMVLAERMGGLSGPAMIAGAAIGAIGYAAYEIIKSITEADDALRGLQNTMANMGKSQASLDLTGGQQRDALRAQITDLANYSGIAKNDAAEVAQAIEGIATASTTTTAALEHLAPVMAVLSNQEPAKAAQALATAFGSMGGMDKLASQLNLFGLAERKAFDEAQRTGNVLKAQAITVHALQERYQGAAAWARQFSQSQEALSNVKKPEGAAPTSDAPDQAPVQAYQQDQKTLVTDTRQTLDDIKANWTRSRSELADLSEQTWEAVVASQRLAGAQELAAEREVDKAKAEVRQASYAEELSQAKANQAQMEASGNATRAQLLTAEIADNQRLLSSFHGNADERRSLETETNVLISRLHAEQKAETLRGLQEVVAGTKAASLERIAAEAEVYAYAVKTWGAGSAQAKQAWDAGIASLNQYQSQLDAIEQRRQQTTRDVAAISVQIDQDALEAQVQAGEITEQEKIAQLQKITQATYEANLEQLQSDLARYDEGTKDYEEYSGKIAVLVAQNMRDQQKAGLEMATANKASADASARSWEQAAEPIQRATDSAMQGVFMGTQSASMAVKRSAANMALSFIEALASMTAKWLVFQAAQALGWTGIATSVQKSMSESSMAWIMGENTKTAATMQSNAQRTASDNASETSFLGKIAARLSAWLGFEGSKTAATVGGDAAEATSETTATAASITASKAQAAADIPASAAQAGAAAYASTAAIPIVGPGLAPAAAAEAYGATMSFMGLASAAGGWDNVPYDGALTELHKAEMVLPASIAVPLRAAISTGQLTAATPSVPQVAAQSANGGGHGAANSSSSSVVINNNIQAVDQASVANALTRSGSAMMNVIQTQQRMGASLARRIRT